MPIIISAARRTGLMGKGAPQGGGAHTDTKFKGAYLAHPGIKSGLQLAWVTRPTVPSPYLRTPGAGGPGTQALSVQWHRKESQRPSTPSPSGMQVRTCSRVQCRGAHAQPWHRMHGSKCQACRVPAQRGGRQQGAGGEHSWGGAAGLGVCVYAHVCACGCMWVGGCVGVWVHVDEWVRGWEPCSTGLPGRRWGCRAAWSPPGRWTAPPSPPRGTAGRRGSWRRRRHCSAAPRPAAARPPPARGGAGCPARWAACRGLHRGRGRYAGGGGWGVRVGVGTVGLVLLAAGGEHATLQVPGAAMLHRAGCQWGVCGGPRVRSPGTSMTVRRSWASGESQLGMWYSPALILCAQRAQREGE